MSDQTQRDRLIRILDRETDQRPSRVADAILADGWVRIDDAAIERMAQAINPEAFAEPSTLHPLFVGDHRAAARDKVRAMVAALTNPSTEETTDAD